MDGYWLILIVSYGEGKEELVVILVVVHSVIIHCSLFVIHCLPDVDVIGWIN